MTPQSRIFETKYADNAANKFDGDKEGDQWKGRTRNYFCGLIPAMKPLLEWAESFGKNPIAQADVANFCLYCEDEGDNDLEGAFNSMESSRGSENEGARDEEEDVECPR